MTPEPNDSVMYFEDWMYMLRTVFSTTKSFCYYGIRSFVAVDNGVKLVLFISSLLIGLFLLLFIKIMNFALKKWTDKHWIIGVLKIYAFVPLFYFILLNSAMNENVFTFFIYIIDVLQLLFSLTSYNNWADH